MRRVCVKAYLPPAEKNRLDTLADRAGLSGSELVRRLVAGAALADSGDRDAVRDLLKVNADLARAGNLLKLAIDEGVTSHGDVTHGDVMDLLTEIRLRQGEIKRIVARIGTRMKQRRRRK